MSSGTSPVRASVVIDRGSTPDDLPGLDAIHSQLDGSRPFVRVVRFDRPCAPIDVLPVGATIERCVTTDSSVTVLARQLDATFHVSSWPGVTTITMATPSHERTEELARELRARQPLALDDELTVRVWNHSHSRPASSSSRALDAPEWNDIAVNYPARVAGPVEQLVALNRPTGSAKLILWHGPPGTGKTTALRSLMRAWAPWCRAQYIADPEHFFGEPAYISQVLTTAPAASVGPTLTDAGRPEAIWRLVIAEDSDEYLRASARRDAGAALGRLLNLADGILGQGMNVLILLTTNEEIARLHPALVRPGRCLAAVEFTPFDPVEATSWLGAPVEREATLAELLQRRGDLVTLNRPRVATGSTGQYL